MDPKIITDYRDYALVIQSYPRDTTPGVSVHMQTKSKLTGQDMNARVSLSPAVAREYAYALLQAADAAEGFKGDGPRVYLVAAGEYDDYAVRSVHLTREAAEIALAEFVASEGQQDIRESASVEEWTA